MSSIRSHLRRLAGGLVVVISLSVVTACGYGLVGRGVTTDPSIKRVGVPPFKDHTGRTALDQLITRKVIEELLRRGKFEVVPGTEGVDAVVDGEILSSLASPVGFSTSVTAASQASRYAVTITAKVTYSKAGETDPLWSNDAFVFRDEYDMGENPATFFDREDESLERLATAFSRSLVAAMLEAF